MPSPSKRLGAIRRELKNFSYTIDSHWYADEYFEGEMILIGVREVQRDADDRRAPAVRQGFQITFTTDWLVGPRGGVNIGNLKFACNLVAHAAAQHEVDEWLRYKGKPLHSPHFDHTPYAQLAHA